MRRTSTAMTVMIAASMWAGEAAAQEARTVACDPSPRMAVEGRASAYDSTVVTVAGQRALVCYGRPSLRGRTMIGGGAVPYGRLWRTGANEPTIIHLPFRAEIAGMALEPGSYSIYTVPGETEWVLILNRSTSQWGHESAYTEEVAAQEVGRATVPAERLTTPIETFTIRSEARDEKAALVLEWQQARIKVPIRAL